jgi:hypothetical protein
LPVTVLYPEARQTPDELERAVFGPDVHIVRRDAAALSELSDADCAAADLSLYPGAGRKRSGQSDAGSAKNSLPCMIL